MSFVGAFPGHSDHLRKTIRAPSNPLDKSTIISIYPKPIEETKHTIEPGRFKIEPGSYEKPAILTIGPSSWWRETEENQPLLEIPIASISIANSIIVDWANGLLACNMGDCMPGLFFLPGTFTQKEIIQNHKAKLDIALLKQRNWYSALVKLGDMLWSRSNGNPLSISEDMKLAARELNLMNKEWIKDSQIMELVRCIACQTLIQSTVIVCPNCKVIVNEIRAKELNLKFAQ